MGNMNSPSIRPILGRQFSHFHSHAYTVSLRGEGCDTGIPSSKKTARRPCEPIRSPSTVIPSAAEGSLLHCRHMHTCASFSPVLSSVFHDMSALSAPTGHLPLEWKAAIREYHLLNRRHTTLVNLSAPQVPSSQAQPRDFYCTAAICTHAPSLKRHLSASFFAFPSPTFYRSAGRIPPLRSG